MGRAAFFKFLAVLGFIIIGIFLVISIIDLVEAAKLHAPALELWKATFFVILFTILSLGLPLLFWTVGDLLEESILGESSINPNGSRNMYEVNSANGVVNKTPKEIARDEKTILWMYKRGIIDEDEKNKKLKQLQKDAVNNNIK